MHQHEEGYSYQQQSMNFSFSNNKIFDNPGTLFNSDCNFELNETATIGLPNSLAAFKVDNVDDEILSLDDSMKAKVEPNLALANL
ncbi:hypothetical protein WICMUC_002302 [Wickerhamomyces mucosus]|uniref:Uncharacterized protein n=1 Tax=Wickerhamomyces mucosus TaxID=1378264 RepID=A0A9P8TEK8_9ASCO|nr:hypothetical protein WICMUC_002302 [Wickerhamomyces mucosus]